MASRTGATTSFIGLSCRCSCAGMPTIIERDVRPMKIAFEFPTCQRRRGATPKSATGLQQPLRNASTCAVHSAAFSKKRPVAAVVEKDEVPIGNVVDDGDADL